MDEYLLSYSPNDFFWVSVKDNFDFTQCDALLKTVAPSKFATDNREIPEDVSAGCPTITCPAQPACPTPAGMNMNWAPNSTLTPTHTPHTDYVFDWSTLGWTKNLGASGLVNESSPNTIKNYATEICKNHAYSKKLRDIQNETSTSQKLFSDIQDKTNTQIREITNMSIGMFAILVTGTVIYLTEQ